MSTVLLDSTIVRSSDQVSTDLGGGGGYTWSSVTGVFRA